MDRSILSMSDDEMLALGPDAYEHFPQTEEPAQQEEVTEPVQTEAQVEPEQTEEQEEEEEQEEQPGTVEPVVEEPVVTPDPATEPVNPTEPVVEPAAKEEKPKVEDLAAKNAADIERLFKPFKASGREIKVDSIDEVIQLMQKGVNYHDKMAGLKPSIALVRMLEREGLNDPQQLGFLIDLHKKNPDAIAKLVKDSKFDSLEHDDTKTDSYKPGNYGLSESETALEDVLTELKTSPAFEQVISFAGNQMDTASRKVIGENPGVLLLIADHVESGMYDVIQAELTKQKMLGNLKGMNDLEAYDAVGKDLGKRGAFNHLQKIAPAVKQEPVVIAPKQKVVDPAVAKAKAAAAPAKASPTGKAGKQEFNPLSLSDDEFAKLAGKQY